jgi:hypothetical protein
MSIDNEIGQRRRRRVRLSPTRSIPVPFTGARGGEGPLTLGQGSIHGWLSHYPDHIFAILCVELPVPATVSVEDVAETVAVLVARHESLRTTYVFGEHPRQRVAAAGVQMLEVCSLGEGQWEPRDRPAVAAALVRWLRESPDPARPPMRLVVATDADDRVVACAAGFWHLAMDHGSIEVIQREFADLLCNPTRRQVGQPRHQPLDQAELEATPAERRRADAALEHLRAHSWRVPHNLYTLPGTQPNGESLAVELSSLAAAMAVRRVAARTRTSRSAIVLAAICAVVARRANYPELVLSVLSNNRFDRHLVNYVGCLAQGAMATVEIGARSFDELAHHTWTSVLEASRHARYDGAKRGAMDEQIQHERGLRFTYDPLFNSLVPESWSGLTAGVGFQPEEIDAALARTELRWRPIPSYETPIRFGLNQIDGRLRLDGWSADTGRVPRAELESLLLAVERLLVAAAHGDVPGDRMPELIGLDPIAGSPDRILVDSCWVDVAEVQRLVNEAVAPTVAHVFASEGDHPLVAHLTATDDVRTPEQAHARCIAALPRHPTAITPRHYVIHAIAPADPANPTAWPAPIAAGTGRARPTTA